MQTENSDENKGVQDYNGVQEYNESKGVQGYNESNDAQAYNDGAVAASPDHILPPPPSATPAPPPAPPPALPTTLDRVTSYKVELKLGFAQELTEGEQTNVKKGIASAAKVFVENVDLNKDRRRTRSVTYTATVYTEDASSAATVAASLGETALKSALARDGAPTPTSVSASPTVNAGQLSPGSRSTASVFGCLVMALVSVGIFNTWQYLK